MTEVVRRRAQVAVLMSVAILPLAPAASHGQVGPNERFSPLATRPLPNDSARLRAAERAVPSPDALQNGEIEDLSSQIASLRNALAADQATIASLRSDIEGLKLSLRPPHGYTRAFITKYNWNNLGDSVGIIYYAPINER
jgi:hypothetical protein